MASKRLFQPCISAGVSYRDFTPKAKNLIERMRKQGADTRTSQRFLRRIMENHPENFSGFHLTTEDIIKALF